MSLRENLGDKQRAYANALRAILDRLDILDGQALQQLKELIRDLQGRVLHRLEDELRQGDPERWGLFWIPRLIQALDQVVFQLGREAGDVLGPLIGDAYQIGADLVDAGAEAVGRMAVSAPVITPITLKVLAPFSADLITAITDETRDTVNRAIRLNVALGEGPHRLMQELAKDITTKGTPFRTVAYRTEVIARTEISRAQALGNQARMEQISREFPDFDGGHVMKKQFIAVQRGPYPCKTCRPYDGTVWDVNDPRAPSIPLHPNCRCCYVPYFHGISSRAITPERETKRQERHSVTAKECCC